jgi:hypothetical protein
MAVKGLDVFREYFVGYEGAFLLIGGVACDAWFAEQGLGFRATADLDIVLVIEAVSTEFVKRFHSFIEEGDYKTRTRSEAGTPEFYRFQKPANDAFPKELELFSRRDELRDLREDQRIIPVRIEDAESLSAVLLDDDYYSLIMENRRNVEGIWMADAAALIPLKARAWIDLTARKAAGEPVDSKKIKKHRRDVFALAATLPNERGPRVSVPVLSDLRRFCDSFPSAHSDWGAILDSIAEDIGGRPPPGELLGAIAHYFSITD